MYLSRIALDTGKRATMRALASPNLFHGALESCFDGNRGQPLWRIDMLNGVRYLLILTETETDFSSVAEQFGYSADKWECKPYDTLLGRVAPESRWHFRITANPTYSKVDPSRPQSRGKIHAHKTPDHQRKWLQEQGEKHGFRVTDGEFDVVESKWLSFYRKAEEKPLKLLSVTFEGLLQITDVEEFRHALCHGIGRAKAYGMGMMTIVSCHGK